jgi:hypothetical protein
LISTRESGASEPNELLQPLDAQDDEGNAGWFARSPVNDGIVLLGGSSLADFRLRYAQSQLRSDLTPSYWSMCGVILADGSIRTAPLSVGDVSDVPRTNGVEVLSIEDVDDPVRWPNIAVLRFAEDSEVVAAHADLVAQRRTIVDLPALVLAWLAYVWATDEAANPLAGGNGIPSAAFVEAAHSLAGIELTPGLATSASCPEAIWQAVKWWHEYYAGVKDVGAAGVAGATVPWGRYALRQRSAAVLLAEEAASAPPDSATSGQA